MSGVLGVTKIAWYLCGRQRYRGRARKLPDWHKHLHYIASKPEADLGDERALGVGDEWVPGSAAAGHVRYAAEKEHAAGVVVSEGVSADWREVTRVLNAHPLPGWRIIDAPNPELVTPEMQTVEYWRHHLEEAMPGVIKAMRLDSQHARWFAVFHNKVLPDGSPRPHAHIVVWEYPHRSARQTGWLKRDEMRVVRNALVNDHYRDRRLALMQEKSSLRETILALAGDDLSRAGAMLKALREGREEAALEVAREMPDPLRPPERVDETSLRELARRLEMLAAALPGRGRVALAYMPAEVKAQVAEIVAWMREQPAWRGHFTRWEEAALNLAQQQTDNPARWEDAVRRAREDIERRVGQRVLKAAALLAPEREVEAAAIGVRPEALEAMRHPAYRVARALSSAVVMVLSREHARAEAACMLAQRREMERRQRMQRIKEREEERSR